METWHSKTKLRTCAATIGCTSQGNVFPIRCKRWDCETCAAINARIHAVRVASGIYAMITAGVVPQFVTLTLPGKIRRQWAFDRLADMWSTMHDKWHYELTKRDSIKLKELTEDVEGKLVFDYASEQPLTYAAFVELQGRGVPHFHIVTSYSPKTETLRKMAVKSGLGFEIKTERVKSKAGVAWYISKYAGKTQGKMGLPKGFRRVRYSRDWPGMKLKIDNDEDDIDKIIKHFDESVDEFIHRAHSIYNVDIRQEVYTLIDDIPDDRLIALVNGSRKTDYSTFVDRLPY